MNKVKFLQTKHYTVEKDPSPISFKNSKSSLNFLAPSALPGSDAFFQKK